MARYKPYDYDQSVMIPLCLEEQLQPGTFEYAVHHLIEERFKPEFFADLYENDQFGARAYSPQMLLKVILFGYSRGLNSSRKLERTCHEQVLSLPSITPQDLLFRQPRLAGFPLPTCHGEDILTSQSSSLRPRSIQE